MKPIEVSRRIVRIAVLAGMVASWLLAGVGGAAGVSDWTTTFQVECSAAPYGYYIQAIGNLYDKQGRPMPLDGSKTYVLFATPCWNDLETFTYTHTTKHQPTQVLLDWYVVGVYTNETLFVCSPGGTMAAIPASIGSNCGAYGSLTESVTTTR